MVGRTIISNPQNRVKDCYAPAPRIDLTLRSNGEEDVCVIDSLGRVVPARIDAPINAAIVNTTTTAASFPVGTATIYFEYRYVYVMKTGFPLVENVNTGGGSPAPRSNPSPSVPTNVSPSSNFTKVLSIPTTQAVGVSHIWIYRTAYLSDAASAATFSKAGSLFWIGETPNNPNLPAVKFIDTGESVGLTQIENDNFGAPQFQFCQYIDPYFYGIGNYERTDAVTIDSTGLMTLTDPTAKWYSGRNGQIVTLDGVQAGGFDNNGKFYFKAIDNTTAQLYLDLALTIPGGPSVSGTTTSHIQGPAVLLYRSKIRNPFSWGYTDVIGDTQVPALYFHTLGGKQATSISSIPNLNLLKIDVESPNNTYIFNLKNAGTPNFEDSRRIITNQYCTSSHFSQFSATIDGGRNALWSIDAKSYSIIECDGATQQPISDKIYDTMRSLALDANDQLYFHGIYDPRTETNCIFIRTKDSEENNLNTLLTYHWPTRNWSICDVYDVLCSCSFIDRFTGENKVLVGSERGRIGELFAKGQHCHWYTEQTTFFPYTPGYGSFTPTFVPNSITNSDLGAQPFAADGTNPSPGVMGNWMTIVFRVADFFGSTNITTTKWLARIATVANSGNTVTFDIVYVKTDKGWIPSTVNVDPFANVVEASWYIGLIEMQVGRSFTAQLPFSDKKIEEVLTNWIYPNINSPSTFLSPPTVSYYDSYPPEYVQDDKEQSMFLATPNNYLTPFYKSHTNIPVDLAKTFGMIIRDRNYSESSLINYELRMTRQDGSNN